MLAFLPSLGNFKPQSRILGQTNRISNSLSPKRDCGSKGVKYVHKSINSYNSDESVLLYEYVNL